MKEMKRILSLVLCFVMLVGLLPNLAFLAKAEEKTPVDALVVMSDLHVNTDESDNNVKQQLVKDVLTAIDNGVGAAITSVNSAGDMFSSNTNTMEGDASTVTGWVNAVLDVPVNYVWTDHDRAATDISKQSSLVEYDNYYVYLLSMADLGTWDRYSAGFYGADKKGVTSTDTVMAHIAQFEADVADLDKTKPLFIVGHQPLFDDRGDNGYASVWVEAINKVAETMDVAYFHGHNHNYDDNDQSYYYAKGTAMSVPNTKVLSGFEYSTDLDAKDVVLNFTHINAGYLNPETTSTGTQKNARMGTALAVVIYEDSIRYTTYDASGVYTDDFAVDVTVERKETTGDSGEDIPETPEVPETSEPSVPETTVPSVPDDGQEETETVYVLVDAPVDGGKYLISNVSLANKDRLSNDWGADSDVEANKSTEEEGAVLIKNGVDTATYKFVTVNNGTNDATHGIFLNEGDVVVGDVTYSDGYITLPTENADAVWTAVAVQGGWMFENAGGYLDFNAQTRASAVWTYNANENLLATGADYLYFSYINTAVGDWTWRITDTATGNSTRDIFFYQEVEGIVSGEGGETPDVPSEPEVPEVELKDEATDVKVSAPGVTVLTVVTDDENETILKAVERLFKSTPKIYDITVEGFTTGDEATVTLPIPEGVTNPAVYYVSDNGIFATNMKAEKVGNYVTFKTTHFSYYVVGEDENDPIYQNVVVEGGGTPSLGNEDDYKNVTAIKQGGGWYAIKSVNPISDHDGRTLRYLTGNTASWNGTPGLKLVAANELDTFWYITRNGNGTYSLRCGTDNEYLTISDRSANVTSNPVEITLSYNNNGYWAIYWRSGGNNYYLNDWDNNRGVASGWGADNEGSRWHLYEVDMNTEITYSVSASDVTLNMVDGKDTANLSYKLLSNGADANLSDVTWSFEEVADPNNVISVNQNGTITFSGAGTGKVKISCTWNQDGENVTAYRIVTVTAKVPNNYPEHPDEGAVKVNKTGTGIDFQSSGLAQIEISASGVPMEVGVDVIVMLDLSSSMKRCIEHDNSDSTHISDNGCTTRLEALRAALGTLETELDNSPNKDQIRIAVADFNGFYSSGAVARDDDDHMNDDSALVASGSNYVFTADDNKTINAEAFVTVDELNTADFTLTPASGTNYDYAFDTIYQLGTAIREYNEIHGQADRELVVLFMSDGAANQYNFYHSIGGNDEENANYSWNHWLLGTMTNAELTDGDGGRLNDDAHAYYYDKVDHDKDGYVNEHRMANAIKGDLGTEHEVIRKDAKVTDNVTLENAKDENGRVIAGDLYMAPGLGATMYSIAFDIAHDGKITDEAVLHTVEQIATSREYYVNAASQTDLENAFRKFASDILYAANNARFVDQMGDDYNLQLKTHTYEVVVDNNGTPDDLSDDEKVSKTVAPTIEILEYEIYTKEDADKDANDNITEEMIGQHKLGADGKPIVSKVLETITFNAAGTEAYSDQITATRDNGQVYHPNIINGEGIICAKYFWYNTNPTTDKHVEGVRIPTGTTGNGLTSGSTDLLPAETFYWNMGQVKTTELAMRYYVYLEDSMEGKKDAGSYPTNNFATLYYDNYLGNPCYKDTISPVLAWKSATVSYAFYLVDDQGRPVINQTTGATGSFANRIAVTNPVIYDQIMLNSGVNLEAVLAAADDVLPNYYTLYDIAAQYQVNVNSNGSGDWTITVGPGLNETTYVTGYNRNDASAYTHDPDVDELGYDYTHTTVWFAVKYQIEAHPDTVVIDYGLPVDISVLVNDMFGDNGELAAIGAYNETLLNKKGGNEGLATGFGATYKGTYGSATMHTDTGKVRYTLNTSNGMQMQTYEQFMYAVNYTGTVGTNGYYYDTITVIPATTIYYEDNFLTYESFTWDYGTNNWASVDEKSDKWTWTQIGAANGTQAEDRPGQYSLTDANNIYGYDKANLSMSEYSMGNALKATVDYDNKAHASFTFWGTGFDIISMTDTTTGLIYVDVERLDASAEMLSFPVDTYYGYTGVLHHVTYTYTNGEWVRTVGEAAGKDAEGNDPKKIHVTLPETAEEGTTLNAIENVWVLNPESEHQIWQVPVIKLADLPYGNYKVTIEVFYTPVADHVNASYEGSYDFYLDAIRIYDPANDGAADGTGEGEDNTIEDAYKQDHEGWPSYFELRNGLIAANSFGDQEISNAPDKPLVGLVFIDGDAEVGSLDIDDYISFGPNNEVYLAPGQRVAFLLSDVQLNGASIVDKVHIGIKSADGKAGTYTITNIAKDDSKGFAAGTYYGPRTYNIDTSTDMYYDLTAWKGDIIVISNTGAEGSGIISLTNIKATYTQSPEGAVSVVVSEKDENNTQNPDDGISTASAGDELAAPSNEVFAYFTSRAATLTLRALNAPAVQEPEDTEPEVPETEVPETTVPETTVPESSEPETTVPEATKPAKPDNSQLKAAVNAAKKLKEKDYTKDSFEDVKDALKDAEKVLKNKNASQSKIDAALEVLNEAVEALEAKPNAEALQKAVNAAKKLKEKDYTKDSFEDVKDALKDAEKVLKNKNASQSKIDAALEALNEAVEALEAKPNAEALQRAVDGAKKLKEKDYTKDSFKAVKDALKDAEKVLKNKNASQSKIDAALAELKAAVEALETKAPAAKPGKPNPKEVVESIIKDIISLIDDWFGGRNG